MNPPPLPSSKPTPLGDTGRGAIIALVRMVEIHDPAIAHRSALRTLVASRLADELGLDDVERSHVIATSALADIDLAVAQPSQDTARDLTRSMLAATLTERIPGLGPVAVALRHQLEWWDGTGGPGGLVGTDIPIAARVAAVTDDIVGSPAPGFVPTWGPALTRVELRAGTALDPTVVAALRRADLGGIEAPPIPSATIIDLFDAHANAGRDGTNGSAATDIATAVAAASRVDDLLQLFADIALRSIDAAHVAVLRLSRTSIEEEPLALAIDADGPPLDGRRLDSLAEFSMLAELRAGVPVRRGPEELADAAGTRSPALRAGSDITVPIMLRGEAWGVLNAARRGLDRHLDNHDLSVLRHIASQAALALANTVRWAEIEQMALRDQLTGLANRHVLNAVLDEIFERDAVDRQDCAVIMCDVDGLKLANDNDGHEAGDRLLIDAAAALRGATRDPERTTICRIGGDEFCLVIDGGALLTAHEISDTIERLFERSGGVDRPRSISCGIAFATPEIETRSQLLRAADQNQYQTKRARRAARGEPIEADTPRVAGDRRAIRDQPVNGG